MFDALFGWRKASKCKKLIARVQCRLKLLKNKRFAIVKQLREDIAQLLKDGHEHIAFNRLEYLYKDERTMFVYEMLDNFSEFIIHNMSYIRRHKDIPKDISEAVSTLIFASARCGDLPELRLIRKLFSERYGQKFAASAVELHAGNVVNHQVMDNLTPRPVSEDVKNRLLDDLIREYFFKPGPLAIEYKPQFHAQPAKMTSSSEVQQLDIKETSSSTNCCTALQSSLPIAQIRKDQQIEKFSQLSTPHDLLINSGNSGCSSENFTQYPEESVGYLDDVEEFKSPTKQDLRVLVFKSWSTHKVEREHNTSLTRKRIRRRSVSREKSIINDAQCEIHYSYRPQYRRKHRKRIEIDKEKTFYCLDKSNCACRYRCSLDRPCCLHTNDFEGYENIFEYHVRRDEIEEMGLTSPLQQTPKREGANSSSMRKCGAQPPYVGSVTMPQIQEKENQCKDISRSNSLPLEKVLNCELKGAKNLTSPRYVHPKLPDYDQIAAMFTELKKVYQQNKGES